MINSKERKKKKEKSTFNDGSLNLSFFARPVIKAPVSIGTINKSIFPSIWLSNSSAVSSSWTWIDKESEHLKIRKKVELLNEKKKMKNFSLPHQ